MHRVPPTLAHGLAPKLMAPEPEQWKPFAVGKQQRRFYTSVELPECAVLAVSAQRRNSWSAVLSELTGNNA